MFWFSTGSTSGCLTDEKAPGSFPPRDPLTSLNQLNGDGAFWLLRTASVVAALLERPLI